MTVIGITGPTGAGKTTLLQEVERLGGGVIDCDAVYHELLKRDTTLQDRLEQAFGPLRDEAGAIDRKKLGAVVFRDPEKLEILNAIAWEAVVARTRALVSPLRELCQLTVAVLAPTEVRVRRVMAREGISEEYAWARVKAQKPDGYFVENCDHVLVNDCETAEDFAQKAQEFLEPIYTQSL